MLTLVQVSIGGRLFTWLPGVYKRVSFITATSLCQESGKATFTNLLHSFLY